MALLGSFRNIEFFIEIQLIMFGLSATSGLYYKHIMTSINDDRK
jgi:hypothetical protein